MSHSKYEYEYETNTYTNAISGFRRILIDLQRDVGGLVYVPALIRNLIDLSSLSVAPSLCPSLFAIYGSRLSVALSIQVHSLAHIRHNQISRREDNTVHIVHSEVRCNHAYNLPSVPFSSPGECILWANQQKKKAKLF